MVDVNVFSGKPIERVSDVARIKPLDRNPDKNRNSNSQFEEVLEREKNVLKKKSAESRKKVDAMPLTYGFINYYNGKAQNAYFCMLNSTTNTKV